MGGVIETVLSWLAGLCKPLFPYFARRWRQRTGGLSDAEKRILVAGVVAAEACIGHSDDGPFIQAGQLVVGSDSPEFPDCLAAIDRLVKIEYLLPGRTEGASDVFPFSARGLAVAKALAGQTTQNGV